MVVCGPQFEPAEVNLKRSFHFIMVTTFLFAGKDNLLENFQKKKTLNSSQELGSLFQVKKLAEKTKKQRETESQKDKSLSYPPPPPPFFPSSLSPMTLLYNWRAWTQIGMGYLKHQ